MSERGPIVREVAVAYAAAFAATAVLGAVRGPAWAEDAAHLGVSAVFLGGALALARREPDGARRFGIDLAGLLEPPPLDAESAPGPLGVFELLRALRDALPTALRELGVALALALLVFPPFVLGFWLWHAPAHALRWSPPADLASFALTQFVLVGLPEEAFFRGFVQTRLTDAWPATRRVLGARVSPHALFGQAALFALVHLASDPHPEELATFFPGLVFGWLRASRGGVGAALTFHALSNVLSELLVRGWLFP